MLPKLNLQLLCIGIGYVVINLGLLRLMGFRSLYYESFVFFSFVAPTLAVALVRVLRLAGVKYSKAALLAFSVWMVLVGWLNYWLITAAWAFI